MTKSSFPGSCRAVSGLIAMILLLGLLSGCVSPAARLDGATSHPALEQWLDSDLIPYLVQTITGHPRLKGQSFAVVSMSDGDIQPRIDGFTLRLRRRLTDALASAPGLRMLWQPSREHRHHRRLRGADCGDSLPASYFIGIESEPLPGNQRRVAVRILDAREGTWIGGIGRHWQGRLTPSQYRASQHSQQDELLRGLRTLPFNADQPDLAAAYFANNLSCLLRQRGLSETRVHVLAPTQAPAQLTTLLALLDNYLSRLHQVRVTRRAEDAEYLLYAEAHPIGSGLFQVWLSLRPGDSSEHVAGLDTAAYVRLNATPTTAPPVATVNIAGTGPGQAPERRPRINGLQLVHPAAPALCHGRDPWRQGQIGVGGNEPLSSDDCFMLRAHTENSERLFLVLLRPNGELIRLTPGGCGRSHLLPAVGDARLIYPTDQRPLRLAHQAGIATMYAIAVNDAYLAYRLQQHLQRLPDPCGTTGQSTPAFSTGTWTRTLDHLLASRPRRLAWTARRLRFIQ